MPRSNDGGSTPKSAPQKNNQLVEGELQKLDIIRTANKNYKTNQERITQKEQCQLPIELFNFLAGVTSDEQTDLLVGM